MFICPISCHGVRDVPEGLQGGVCCLISGSYHYREEQIQGLQGGVCHPVSRYDGGDVYCL